MSGTPRPSPEPSSSPLPPDVERLHEVWAGVRVSLAASPPNTPAEFAGRARELWDVLLRGLESVAQASPQDEELKTALRESRSKQHVLRTAALAATSADVDALSGAFAQSAERIRLLADPQALEKGQ